MMPKDIEKTEVAVWRLASQAGGAELLYRTPIPALYRILARAAQALMVKR